MSYMDLVKLLRLVYILIYYSKILSIIYYYIIYNTLLYYIGDIKSFNDIMNLYMTSFIKLGIYLLLEHCRFVLYRNLLKRIHTITSSTR